METFVESGSFGIDPARAAEILRSRGLEAADAAPLLWVRLAVLRGATKVLLAAEPGGFIAQFDGTPLPRAWSSRPYDTLLGEKEGTEAERQFAQAMLHLAAPSVTVAVESGAKTRVRATWPRRFRAGAGHPARWDLSAQRALLDPTPVPVELVAQKEETRVRPWGPRWGAEGWTGTVDGLRCGVRVLKDYETEPVAQLALHGVGVRTVPLSDFPLSADGWVDCPELSLNASLSKAVQDDAHARATAALAKAVGLALCAALARHSRRMRLAAAALRRDRDLMPLWRQVWARESPFKAGPSRRGRLRGGLFRRASGDAALIEDTAAWNAVWRSAVLNRVSRPETAAFRAALWEAPLLFDKGLVPRSVREAVARRADEFPDGEGFLNAVRTSPGR